MKKSLKIFLTIILTLVILIGIVAGVTVIVNKNSIKASKELISSISPVEYSEQLIPKLEDDGYYSFKTERDLKTVQLTDIHLGGGFLSTKKDGMAINAVASMLREEKPDLVVVTGDLTFPVPFIAGTFNNKEPAKLLAELMEQLGVYWCLCYGNHDTEAYSYFDREEISELYSNKELYPHCLFQSGPEDVDGYGNYVINVRNSLGEIIQSLFIIDSHSYTDNDYFGILWKYDCVHKNQIEWYKNEVTKLTEENYGRKPNSLLFMHIPIKEMQDAYAEYSNNDYKDTDRVKFLGGDAGEKDDAICCSQYNNGLFDALKSENSTKGVFFGHDHLNTFSIMYDGIKLCYSNSIDYLAYPNINKYGAQRGCTVINIKQDGTFDYELQNYYQDKYNSQDEKSTISFDEYGSLDK